MEIKDGLSAAVLEVLDKDNYVAWSVMVKLYLMAQDLWEVVETTTEPPKQEDDEGAFKAWSKKNSMALHVIKLSCGRDTFFEIIHISSAKIAWDTLVEKYHMPTYTNAGSSENGNVDYDQYEALKEAVQSGDWNTANDFLTHNPDAAGAKITFLGQTALHIAVKSGHEDIVEKLMDKMSEEHLAIKNCFGNTALASSLNAGSNRMAVCMLRKSKNLISIKDAYQNIPVSKAVFNGHIELAQYLYSLTPPEDLTPKNDGTTLCTRAIYNQSLDIALDLIKSYPDLALAQDKEGCSPLYALASTPDAFPSGDQLVFWKQWIYSCIRIQPASAIKETRLNIPNVEKCQSHKVKIIRSGRIGPSIQLNRIQGAALQMQRELQWFKEVESIVAPRYKEYSNKDGLTPRELFTKNHKDLMKEAEKWMKDTATSCTVVGALIVTIMFAAAFTVPGGNKQDGYPLFLDEKLFMLFIISDAFSLFSSSASVLMFLGILTSRYAEDDFLESLPRKMIIGLSTLFFSIAAMMMTFSAALIIMLHGQSWIIIPIVCLASVPITLFILMQFSVLVDMFISTYGPGIFDKKMKKWV